MCLLPDNVDHSRLPVHRAVLAPFVPRHGKARSVLASRNVAPAALDVDHVVRLVDGTEGSMLIALSSERSRCRTTLNAHKKVASTGTHRCHRLTKQCKTSNT